MAEFYESHTHSFPSCTKLANGTWHHAPDCKGAGELVACYPYMDADGRHDRSKCIHKLISDSPLQRILAGEEEIKRAFERLERMISKHGYSMTIEFHKTDEAAPEKRS